ncbi:D-alanyl-lipoteichoic acid biosynthesis protein DltB, partial [Enterococcus thailandicus]
MMFPHMIPYAEPFYFFLLAIALIPIVLSLLIWKKRLPIYQSVVTLFFLFVSFGGTYCEQGAALIGYVFWQTILVWGYFVHRQRKNQTGWFYAAVILAIIPLFLTKVTPFFEHGKASLLGFLGISYLTFKSVQMIMEIRDGMIKTYKPFRYIQFLLF